MSVPTRPALHTALVVAARVGTAVTLAALLVVTGMVLTLVQEAPTPAGIATSDH